MYEEYLASPESWRLFGVHFLYCRWPCCCENIWALEMKTKNKKSLLCPPDTCLLTSTGSPSSISQKAPNRIQANRVGHATKTHKQADIGWQLAVSLVCHTLSVFPVVLVTHYVYSLPGLGFTSSLVEWELNSADTGGWGFSIMENIWFVHLLLYEEIHRSDLGHQQKKVTLQITL